LGSFSADAESARVALKQWFLIYTSMPNPYVVFQAFVEPHFSQYNRK